MARASAPVILALVVAGTLAGCAFDDRALKVSSPKVVRWTLGDAGGNHYLRLSTKEDDAGGNVILKRDLHPPFRFEVVGGLFGDESLAGAQGMSFGTDLEGFSMEPFQFVGVYAQVQATGISVYGAVRSAGPVTQTGSTFFSGARKIHFVIEHDGANLVLSAKDAAVGGGFTQIGSFSPAGFAWPLWPALGVYHIASDAAVGYDEFRIVSDSQPEGEAPPEYSAVRDVYAALDKEVEAIHAADADAGAALTHCLEALAVLDSAIGKVDGLVMTKAPATGPEPARKLLDKSRKTLLGVIRKLEGGKGGATAIKGLLKAIPPQLLSTRLLMGETD